MKKTTTARGFGRIEFKDYGKVECSIQKSSLATDDAIWFGANKLGVQEFKAGAGWIKRDDLEVSTMEHHFVGNNRMHLTREQVAELLPILQKFVETGDL